jgi:hypothetical protein
MPSLPCSTASASSSDDDDHIFDGWPVAGVVFLQEQVDWSLILGAALVVAGILVVNGPATVRAWRQGPPESVSATIDARE